MLVLDSGGLSLFAQRSQRAAALILAFRRAGLWPPIVPSVVLVESLTGQPGRGALADRFLKTCDVLEAIPEPIARRAAMLRTRARRGSAVDAIVVAVAEAGGTILTQDPIDLRALASHARGVTVRHP
jgi:hypothetical protein